MQQYRTTLLHTYLPTYLPIQRHFTASSFVINSQNQTLLINHKRLQRWMPPGGHVDPDELPEETARRECKEETGLDVEIIGEEQMDYFDQNSDEGRIIKKPVSFLLEHIPASEERNEPAHQHMDFVYLARPLDESQTLTLAEHEGHALRWFTRNEIESLDASSEIFANVKRYILDVLPITKE